MMEFNERFYVCSAGR